MTDQSTRNLKEAFSGESQANRRYLAFANKADEEGFPNIARLFRAAAESETYHAHNHLRAMNGINSTLENAQEAWKGEKEEYTDMYPMFMDQAKRDGNNDALKSFFWANEAEKVHGNFYEKAVNALKDGKDMELKDIHVCSVCGFTIEGEPPEKCPTCGQDKDNFKQVS
jgi:rubrerythrin